MNVPPPIFDLPEPQAPTPENEPRNYIGWIGLTIILLLLAAQAMNGYLGRETKPESKYGEYAQRLKLAVELKESFRSSTAGSQVNSTLDDLAKDLKADSLKNEVAARLYAATLSEEGKKVPDSVLDRMRESDEPRDKVFIQVFGADKLSRPEAESIERQLKDGGFVSKLATAQAYDKAGDHEKRKQLFGGSRIWVIGSVIAGICGAGFVGFCLWILYLSMWGTGRWKPKGLPLERISYADADRLAIRCAQIFGLFIAIPILVQLVAYVTVGKGASGTVRNFMNLGTYALLVCATLLLFRSPIMGKKFSLESIGIHKRDLGKNILWGVGTALANIPLVWLASIAGQALFSWLPKPEHPVTVQLQTNGDWFTTVTLLLIASVGAPILEEIMFRGTMLPALAKVMGRPWVAILVQGLIFAAIHPTGVPAWLALGTIGAMSGFLSRQTGSLVPSMVMHGVHNFGTMILAKTFLGYLGWW